MKETLDQYRFRVELREQKAKEAEERLKLKERMKKANETLWKADNSIPAKIIKAVEKRL